MQHLVILQPNLGNKTSKGFKRTTILKSQIWLNEKQRDFSKWHFRVIGVQGTLTDECSSAVMLTVWKISQFLRTCLGTE